MDGGITSLTVIVCVHRAVLPHTSAAWYVRKIVNRFAQKGLTVMSPINPIVTNPVQLSLAVGAPVSKGGTMLAQETDVF